MILFTNNFTNNNGYNIYYFSDLTFSDNQQCVRCPGQVVHYSETATKYRNYAAFAGLKKYFTDDRLTPYILL